MTGQTPVYVVSLLGGLRDGVSVGEKLIRDGCGKGGGRHGAERHSLSLFSRRRVMDGNELGWKEGEGEGQLEYRLPQSS